jgi:hypothetical protein
MNAHRLAVTPREIGTFYLEPRDRSKVRAAVSYVEVIFPVGALVDKNADFLVCIFGKPDVTVRADRNADESRQGAR